MARILVVDDDSSMRMFLAKMLERAGHDVIVKSNGIEALDELSPVQESAYDLMLADIVMPGMDGIELAQRASDIRPDMKVMFITGFAAVSMGQQNQEMPQTRILSKPFHLKDLVKHVDDVLAA